jgi:DNA-binding CsgD family transcriptional regulator
MTGLGNDRSPAWATGDGDQEMTTEHEAPGRDDSRVALRRRRDDLMNSKAMLDMVRFLMSRPSGDQICQHLVLNLLIAHRPRTAVISLFGSDGSLHAVGAFGMSGPALEPYRTLSLWDSSPMSDAVRSGDPVILRTVQDVEDRYPWLGSKEAPYEPLAVWPLSLPSQRVGAIQLAFTAPTEIDALHTDVTGVAAVLALYLSLLSNPGNVTERPLVGPDGERSGLSPALSLVEALPAEEPTGATYRRTAPGSLSERQLRILGLMAKGLTNSQISKRVGFSESTVRQETMAIYRFFGVGGRREAVRLAGMRGMLDANAM